MRTTIEISETQRGELLKLAAQRGHKGYSQIIQQALDEYLRNQKERVHAIEEALALMGTLPDKQADELEERVKTIRRNWR